MRFFIILSLTACCLCEPFQNNWIKANETNLCDFNFASRFNLHVNVNMQRKICLQITQTLSFINHIRVLIVLRPVAFVSMSLCICNGRSHEAKLYGATKHKKDF